MINNIFFKNSKKINNIIKYINYNFENKYLFINNKIAPEISNNSIYNLHFNYQSNILKQIIKFERNVTLPISYILANDLGSMRASIETRSPFLNRELFEFTNQFDTNCFFKNGNKTPLRNLLKNYLPEELINFSKKGFNVPISNFKISEGELLNKLYNNTNFSDNSLNSFSSKDKDRMSLRFKIIEELKKEINS